MEINGVTKARANFYHLLSRACLKEIDKTFLHALKESNLISSHILNKIDILRVTSGVGYMVTKAKVTEGIHPKVVAVSNTRGTRFGRYALSMKNGEKNMWGGVYDPDLKNIWWTSEAVNPNYIIPVSADPIGGSQGWYDTVVKVTKAEPGDKLGDTKVDNLKHLEFFRETERYAYTGDKHREMHPEVKVEKLPEPKLKIGHEPTKGRD